MAAEATDEDDAEAHAAYHHTHLPGYRGNAPRVSFLSRVFLLVASTIPPHRGAKTLTVALQGEIYACATPTRPDPL